MNTFASLLFLFGAFALSLFCLSFENVYGVIGAIVAMAGGMALSIEVF